ncbi:MAG: 2-amino-4-hydroxy-6-hydroxymethyldihydropteridine diphosphokinase [Magnetospirillum sp. WYHS-4]
MILVALGANLDSPRFGPPQRTLEAALAALEGAGVRVAARSRWFRSAPVPASDQPWFVNGVVRVESGLEPVDLLALLHGIEADFGRVRSLAGAPRVLDLDLLDYEGRVMVQGLVLPHPRLNERAFVLLPLQEVAPAWRHPSSGLSVDDLIAALPAGQECQAIR